MCFFQKIKNLLKKITCCAKREKKIIVARKNPSPPPPPGYQMVPPLESTIGKNLNLHIIYVLLTYLLKIAY